MWLYLAGAILAASQDVSDVTSDAMFETLQTASFNNRKGIIDFSHKKNKKNQHILKTSQLVLPLLKNVEVFCHKKMKMALAKKNQQNKDTRFAKFISDKWYYNDHTVTSFFFFFKPLAIQGAGLSGRRRRRRFPFGGRGGRGLGEGHGGVRVLRGGRVRGLAGDQKKNMWGIDGNI